MIESTNKYALINGKVVDISDPNAPAPATPAKRGRGKKATGTPQSTTKKRKAIDKDDDNADTSDDAVLETPAKKKTPAKRGAAKKAAVKVKEEADVSEEDAQADNDAGDKEASDDEEAGDVDNEIED